MENNELVPVRHFCVTHQIEWSFIESLQQYGLVEFTRIEEEWFLHENQLTDIEKMVRLHYDLDINVEGIEVIGHLLQKLQAAQWQNQQLQNRLRLYENTTGA
ncbi:MAG TPA: chaperone modulator CbpM [Chitinophagaceae bacterium]|nr:chaperone modulator CbpM [Chitinophagaceae bacterium]